MADLAKAAQDRTPSRRIRPCLLVSVPAFKQISVSLREEKILLARKLLAIWKRPKLALLLVNNFSAHDQKKPPKNARSLRSSSLEDHACNNLEKFVLNFIELKV